MIADAVDRQMKRLNDVRADEVRVAETVGGRERVGAANGWKNISGQLAAVRLILAVGQEPPEQTVLRTLLKIDLRDVHGVIALYRRADSHQPAIVRLNRLA